MATDYVILRLILILTFKYPFKEDSLFIPVGVLTTGMIRGIRMSSIL